MSNDRTDLVNSATGGGVSGEHPAQEPFRILVGPSTGTEQNALRNPLIVIACWRMDDIRFEFDSSFLLPDAAEELKLLAVLRRRHPKAPLSIFGHADPAGNDSYNKILSGRRSRAIYGLLIRDTNIWEELYSGSEGTNDKWGTKATDTMQAKLGLTGASPPRNKAERATLFQSYMDAICTDLDGRPFKLTKSDFLGKGSNPTGKADLQGCSEFNPVLMFSKAENQKYESDKDKTARNDDNAPNRRVVIYLFRPGTVVDPQKWPCPTVKEGIAGCQKRFFSDHKVRRSFQATRRKYEETKDTFACRFYDRLAHGSSCEGASKLISMRIFFQRFPGTGGKDEDRGIADVPYKLRVIGISDREGKTDPAGSVKIVMPEGAAAVLEILGTSYELSTRSAIEALDTIKGVQRRLEILGYQPGNIDGTIGTATDQAILQLQADNNLDTNGDSELEAGRSTTIAADIQDKLKSQVGE
ncbi:MAG: peptidoglycan-binding protein [Acidobacteriota bacterium]